MSPRLGVVVGVNAIIRSGKSILLLRRSAQATAYPGRWDLPGGAVEPGETLVTALKREVREETGLAVQVRQIVAARIVYASPSRGGICVTFLCRPRGRRAAKLAPEEHDSFRWVTPQSALRLNLRPPQRQAIRRCFERR